MTNLWSYFFGAKDELDPAMRDLLDKGEITQEEVDRQLTIMEAEKEEVQAKHQAEIDQWYARNVNQRFNLPADARLPLIAGGVSIWSGCFGFYNGLKAASLKYLAENAHRLPKKKGGWYFYHKRKNHVCYMKGMEAAFKNLARTNILVVGGLFGTEALLDKARGQIDFLNTTVAAVAAGATYGGLFKLTRVQTVNLMRQGLWLGLAGGLFQDYFIYKRSPQDVWYAKYALHTGEKLADA
ncbi:hypothetical protein BABINDRAFT_163299 [Babjeviella inositovora NRRL Y-12698]|uniref:Uncharacterized protein n=1 Tax=Babjeviella inositovora NRRL Y-12698 TaxID=984486 RepID=A0A1E3QIN8_9ASCO|nr:uncharacterized protein BABINDRAFT_163299 [Babjeviella inositovora NRRL Y-12698]ODQ77561.1 hypothetical protein BABINDRAFT_163299 [Babjeviella inositovora NRRL Y-12698]